MEFDQYHGNRHYRRLDGTEDPGSTASESSNTIGQDDPGAAFLSSSGNGAGEIDNSTIHSVLRADLLDMIASSTTHTGVHLSTTSIDDRAELLDSATIIETLVVNTSYGIIQMKMPYVCSPDTKEYEFGLPNNLMFIDSGGGWYARRNTTPTVELAYMFGTWEFNPTRDIHNPFIYNVYMNNPTNSELHIWEVYTTKPHIVGAEIQKHFATSPRSPSLGPSPGNKDYLFREGSTIHQPNKNNIYVTTLQLYPSNFTRDMSMTNQELGFLIIKSNLGSFSIALDYIPDTRRGWEKFARQERASNNSTFIHWAGSNQTSLGRGGLVQDSVMDGLLSSLAVDLQKPTPHNKMMSITKSYRVQDLQSKDKGWEGQKYLQKQQKNTNDAADSQQLNSTLSLIKATPPYINFGSITTASRIRIPIQLKNYHSKPLRVMRISIAMSLVSDNGHGKITDISNETSGMEIGVEFYDGTVPTLLNDRNESSSKTSEAFVFSQEMVLPPDNPNMFDFFHPIYVWCRFNTNISSAEDIEARFYTGSILIHATEGGTDVPYQEWERQLILDHSTSASSSEISEHYLLQIPFTGSVLPGHLGGPSESPLFPTYFNILPVEERMKIMKDQSASIGSDVPTYYDRILDISNNFDAAISILDMKIMDLIPSSTDDFCTNRFTLDPMVGEGGLVPLTAQSGKRWNGLIIRYHFMNKTDHLDVGVKKCILSLDTDLAGKQLLPLIVYSGEVIVDVERPSDSSENAGQPPQLAEIGCMVTQENGETIISSSGMPCMKDWLLNTKEGIVLSKALEDWYTTLTSPFRSHRKCEKAIISSSSDDCSHLNAPVDYYFRSLLSNPSEGSDIVLKPIIVPFGAIRTGEALSRSILLTNLNYAPMEIMATSAGLGNMNITMDVVSDSAFDSLGRMSFPAGEEDMSYFMKNSPFTKKFFSKFQYKFDIKLSHRLKQGSDLIPLFKKHLITETFENATEYVQTNYIGKEEKDMACTHGFMLSTDGASNKKLKKRKVHKGGKKKKTWIIPPGGVARFKVTIQAPKRSELKDDIMPFVGTGIVLETNFGEALPIVVTYSAVAGQLELKPFDYNVSDPVKANEEERMVWQRQHKAISSTNNISSIFVQEEHYTTVVQVPLTLKDSKLTQSIDDFAQKRGVSLAIKSTFTDDIYLSELRSCNKWFNVFLPANNPDARDFFQRQGEDTRQPIVEGTLNTVNYLRINGVGQQNNITSAKELKPQQQSSDFEEKEQMVPLGKVLSALSCSHPSGDTSFYACALAWLENREMIQPPGCGLDELENVANEWSWSKPGAPGNYIGKQMEPAVQATKANAIAALRDVVAYLSVRYVGNVDNGTIDSSVEEGYARLSRVNMFVHARKMWNEVVALGLNTITGHIRAKTVYQSNSFQDYQLANSNFTNHSQPGLSIPVSSVVLQSKLDTPKLFWDSDTGDRDPNHVGSINFDTIHIADTASQYVQVINPTAMTIRVRLTAVDSGTKGEENKNVHVQNTPTHDQSWWTGGSYWMADDSGHLISASHNVTIKSGAGAYVSLLNPALHTMSAFMLGCGKRCGLRNDQDTNTAGEEKNYSPIGAASGDGSALLGRTHTKETSNNDMTSSPQKALGIVDPPSFSLGRSSNDIILKPYSFGELGPVYFRPPGRGDFEGTIYIENSLTGFEEVAVRGRGGWEQLVFLESSDEYAGDIDFRFGKSAMVFSGSHSPTSPEGGPIVKSVNLVNKGDIPVHISKVYMASSEVMHFTHKRRHPSKHSSPNRDKCSARGFWLPGCIDTSSNVWLIESLFMWYKSVLNFFLKKVDPIKLEEETGDTISSEGGIGSDGQFYKEGFTLQPNQTQTIFVLHTPDCTFQTSYASVIFEIGDRNQQGSSTSRNRIGSWQQTFRQQKLELLVGYDMSAFEFRHCIPFKPPERMLSIWERKIEIHLPSIVHDVLSLGLTRVKDSDGNPYMPRRPIRITLLAASFILLLAALSLDLIFTVEVSTTRKNSPSWKSTIRCLARTDPTSSDLISIGKEQTKHVLLSRFKKEGVLPSQTVQSDGSFNRAVTGSSGTHSEAIFDRLNLVNKSRISEDEGKEKAGLLPCGIRWRTAMRRGFGLPSSSSQNEAPELQYLSRTRDRYLKRQQEKATAKKLVHFAPASPATPTPPTTNRGNANNGHSTFAELAKTVVPAPAALSSNNKKVEPQTKKKIQLPANGKNTTSSESTVRAAPQSRPPAISRNASDASVKGSNKPIKAKTAEQGKIKKSNTGGVSNDQKTKVVDTKGKQKQAKNSKKDAKQDEKRLQSSVSQKSRSVKPVVDTTSAGLSSKVKRDETLASPSRKETKQQRQAKKAANSGIKSTDQPKGKQGKQKATSKKANAKDTPKSPQAKKATIKQQPVQSPSSSKANVRAPPGLLAPPGFMGQQQDLGGVSSTPSSPSASPQRLSIPSHHSPMAKPMSESIPGMEIIQSPPPLNNDDLLSSLIGGTEVVKPLENSSLFQLPSEEISPRVSESGLSVKAKSFVPPNLEPSLTTETNSSEAPDVVQSLLGVGGSAGSNFNVSNFLDGILDSSTQQQQAAPIRSEPKPVEVEANPFQAIGISLDPWGNSSDNKSNNNKTNNPLAALRGTSSYDHEESPVIAGIPLSSNSSSLFATSTLQNSNTEHAEPALASVVVDEGTESNTDLLEPGKSALVLLYLMSSCVQNEVFEI